MGHTCRAVSLIGFKVPINHFEVTEQVRSFDHDYPEDWTHDPKSGKHLWKTRTTYGKGFNSIDAVDVRMDPPMTWLGFPVHFHKECEDVSCVFIGVAKVETSAYECLTRRGNVEWQGMQDEIERLRTKLQEHGLPTTGFGLWVILPVYS